MILDRVRQICADELCVDLEEVKETSNLTLDLGADSLDRIQLLARLKEEFHLDFEDTKIGSDWTVGKIAEWIKDRLDYEKDFN